MAPGFDSSPSRRNDLPKPPELDFQDLCLPLDGDIHAQRRREGLRLQFEGFRPVVIPPPEGPARAEILPLIPKLRTGDLSAKEARIVGVGFAAATFPKDARGRELCQKLIEGINAFNRTVAHPPSSGLRAEHVKDLPLTRREQREYAHRFAEMEFPVCVFKDDLGRFLWREHITGQLRPHEEDSLLLLISQTGRTLTKKVGGLATLQALHDQFHM
jgi:hypothetical protein